MKRAALILCIPLAACLGDDAPHGYGSEDQIWRLTELNGAPFTARATFGFPETGTIAGSAPCNRYSGAMTVPYPSFRAGPLITTKRACPESDQETAFLSALASASFAEISGKELILSNDAGLQMLFIADD